MKVTKSKMSMYLATLVVAHAPVFAARTGSADALLPLQTMSFEDAASAGAVGTGCTWLGGPEGTRRLAMADDRAAMKLHGRVVSLKPAPGAQEAFPFTYHRWTGAGMDLSIRDTKSVLKKGGEYVETVAWLDVIEKGRTRTWRGRLNCGS